MRTKKKFKDLKVGETLVIHQVDGYEFHSTVEAIGPDWVVTRQLGPHFERFTAEDEVEVEEITVENIPEGMSIEEAVEINRKNGFEVVPKALRIF